MRTVAIVEDEENEAANLKQYISHFGNETNETFKVIWYSNPNIFLQNYTNCFDLVFMDIMMPGENGLEISKKLRKMDSNVIIVFVTNMAKYALKGYEVNAFDFIVKPLNYSDFKIKFNRIVQLWKKNVENKIVIKTNDSTLILVESDIKFIEVFNHKLVYHTVYGNVISYGSLKKIQDELIDKRFVKCNKCYIVNLDYCTGIKDGMLIVGEEQVPLALKKRKEFISYMNEYFGGK